MGVGEGGVGGKAMVCGRGIRGLRIRKGGLSKELLL